MQVQVRDEIIEKVAKKARFEEDQTFSRINTLLRMKKSTNNGQTAIPIRKPESMYHYTTTESSLEQKKAESTLSKQSGTIISLNQKFADQDYMKSVQEENLLFKEQIYGLISQNKQLVDQLFRLKTEVQMGQISVQSQKVGIEKLQEEKAHLKDQKFGLTSKLQ